MCIVAACPLIKNPPKIIFLHELICAYKYANWAISFEIMCNNDLTRSAGLKSSGDLSGVVAALQKDEAVISPDKPILL